jgi:glucose-6-phosphate dehydrogenase assembly protein OpcA
MVDSTRAPDGIEQLNQLELLRANPRWHAQIIDAAWIKLDGWREALASFFDARSTRPALERVSEIEIVAADAISAAYLAGWLASRLDIGPDDGGWARADGTPVTIALRTDSGHAAHGILSVKLVTELRGESMLAHASLDAHGLLQMRLSTDRLSLRRHQLRLPALDEAGWVCGMLQRRERDRVFEASAAIARLLLTR